MLKKGIGISMTIFLLLILLFASTLLKPNKTTNDLLNHTENKQELSTIKETNIPKKEGNENMESKEKINIYLFWGDGCPHCEKLIAFLNNLSEEYSSLFTLHSFEVWHNTDNKNLMKSFSEKVNQNITGVPFLIIGNKTFVGYTSSKDESIKNAIKEEYAKENRVDYYKEINGN